MNRDEKGMSMNYYEKYRSNTIAAGGNQLPCMLGRTEPATVRIFYRITEGGERGYSLLFSNINDSTFADGAEGYCNKIYDEWTILSLKAAVCSEDCFTEKFDMDMPNTPFHKDKIGTMVPLTFDGSKSKTVSPGEIFFTDDVTLAPEKGGYLCVEMTFEGKNIPAYAELLIPTYLRNEANGEWEITRLVPVPATVGAALHKKPAIAFVGDSITCGCGTEPNAYANWCALVAEKLGDAYTYQNFGLGYARAQDMASGGAWFYKASQQDIAVVCYGVNDILQGRDAETIERDLYAIVKKFHSAGVKVFLQTVPPFDYDIPNTKTWFAVNDYIRNVLSGDADYVFDNCPFLSLSADEPQKALYGGHPNHKGCRVWAEALYPVLKNFLKG